MIGHPLVILKKYAVERLLIQTLYRIAQFCAITFTINLGIAGMARGTQPLVLVSSFAEQGRISAFQLNIDSGVLTELKQSDVIAHPFFFDITSNHRYLYTIDAKSFGGKESEQIAAYRLDVQSGQLQLINRQSTHGTASCYVEVDHSDQSVLVANYLSGEVASYKIQPEGALSQVATLAAHHGSSVLTARQQGPHAHCIVVSPNNRFAYAADLGIDKIMAYKIDPQTGKFVANQQPFIRTLPGAGPRHLTFHPGGTQMYVINELHNSVSHFSFEPETGILIERLTISTLPDDFQGESYCADLKITPDGKFLYGTNRGHDSLACYRISEDGALSLIGIQPSRGKGPQNLAITSDGRLLLCANMPGNNLSLFRIDSSSGQLTPIEQLLEIPSPSCIRILNVN